MAYRLAGGHAKHHLQRRRRIYCERGAIFKAVRGPTGLTEQEIRISELSAGAIGRRPTCQAPRSHHRDLPSSSSNHSDHDANAVEFWLGLLLPPLWPHRPLLD